MFATPRSRPASTRRLYRDLCSFTCLCVFQSTTYSNHLERESQEQSVKLDFFRSYVSSAAQAVLAKGNSVPGLPAYQLGERRQDYEGHSIWSLHDGMKRVCGSTTVGSAVLKAVLCFTSAILLDMHAIRALGLLTRDCTTNYWIL
jgi:hypothetical protein